MSNSVAMVTVERVVAQVRRHVDMSEKLARKVAERKNISVVVARDMLLMSATKVALKYSSGDEKRAGMALIIVNGRVNRLPQCTKLLQRYSSKVVRTAYEVKEELSVSEASLRTLCDLVDHMDGDFEGEVSRIQVVLDELDSRELTRKQRFHFHRRLREGVKAGRLIESVAGEILDELDRREERARVESAARSEVYQRVYRG